jgi:hypothetical protein
MTQQRSMVCRGCWQNHIPMMLRGPLCIPFRAVGIRPSRMNPNTCTFCELMFTRVMKARRKIASHLARATRTPLADRVRVFARKRENVAQESIRWR